MEYNYVPKYVKEHLNYQEGEIVKHGAYNRNFNILNIAVDNNTEALKHMLNSGGVSVLDAKALDGAVLKRHRDHELQDNDEQIPSSKAVYEHVEEVRSGIQNSINTINNTLIAQDSEMYKINKRIQVVNSLMEQYKDRADDVELMAQRLEQEFEFTHGTLHGGLTGQVLAKASDDELDYTWTELLPGPQGEQGVPGVPGQDGRDGRDGLDGADGTNGIDGAPGADGQGVPVGGTTGQVLKKKTNADHDTEWGEAASVLVKATGADVITGTDDEKYVTPKAIKDGMSVMGDTLPIGSQIPFGSLTIPDNWLLCDGRAISRADYSELFAVIGTSYGAGNGTTTFNLPNKKGRTSVGYDASQTEFDTIGKTGGAKTHTLTHNELPGNLIRDTGLENNAWGLQYKNAAGWRANVMSTLVSPTNQPHNNLQPYQTDAWIIKAKQSAGVVATVVDTLDSTSPTNALSANMGRELNDKINKQKGFNCHQWSNTVVATTSNANFTDFPGTPTLSFTMSKKGSIVIRASAVVYVTNRTVALTVLLDSTDITSSNCITNCTNTLGETLNLVLKVENVNEGTHSIKLRWRVQNSSDVGTALPYKNSTLEVQEI